MQTININQCNHVLISRTDNIGDVVLTLPLVSILKHHYPHIKITFLARDYVRSVVEACLDVDDFLSWDTLSRMPVKEAVQSIQSRKIDAVIHAFPKNQIAKLMKLARIKYRIGTSRRLYHWATCNQRVVFSRAKSQEHEAQLNLKLLSPFGISDDFNANELTSWIRLKKTNTPPAHFQAYFHPHKFNLIIHPFTNGHTREWPVSHVVSLIRQLPNDRVNILVTGSKKESEIIKARIQRQCPQIVNLAGQCTLAELMQVIAHADGVIANSTGPLHLAAVLGVRTLGIYPATAGVSPTRWGPIGEKVEVLTANPNCDAPRCRAKNDCYCMESVTVDQVKEIVDKWLATPSTQSA